MLNIKEVQKCVTDKAVPGCSLCIIKNDNTMYNYSTGFYSDKNDTKVDRNTVYDLASITKLYTTAIVLRLHENKKLDIFSKCSKYLENFDKSNLTLFDLLTQTANFGVYLSEYRKNKNDFKNNLFSIEPPINKSYEVNYENITFLYLGKIIENVTNEKLDNSFKTLFNDLNLNRSYIGSDLKGINCPPTEIVDGNFYQNKTHDETSFMLGGIAGNAGVFATAEDVAKFGALWVRNKIVNKEMTDLVFSNYSSTPSKGQGIGWWNRLSIPQLMPKNLYCHPGFTGGILAVNSQTKNVYAMTTNRTLYGRDNNSYKKLWNILLSNELSDLNNEKINFIRKSNDRNR